jgi:hypothetical protein
MSTRSCPSHRAAPTPSRCAQAHMGQHHLHGRITPACQPPGRHHAPSYMQSGAATWQHQHGGPTVTLIDPARGRRRHRQPRAGSAPRGHPGIAPRSTPSQPTACLRSVKYARPCTTQHRMHATRRYWGESELLHTRVAQGMEPLESSRSGRTVAALGTMADLAGTAARNIDECAADAWRRAVVRHTPGPSHKMTSNRSSNRCNRANTPTTQTAPAAPGATATQTEGGTRTRAAQHDRRDPPTHAHCPPPARPPAPSTTTTTASWAGSLMGSSATFLTRGCLHPAAGQLAFRMGVLWSPRGHADGLRTDSKCPLCQHEDGGSHASGRQDKRMEKMYTSRHNACRDRLNASSMGAASSLQIGQERALRNRQGTVG